MQEKMLRAKNRVFKASDISHDIWQYLHLLHRNSIFAKSIL